ncbi:DUF881 domain-containing protein [soil metagenome]
MRSRAGTLRTGERSVRDASSPRGYGRRSTDRPGGDRRSVPLEPLLTAAGALLVGFLLSVGLSAGREAARVQNERKDELIALVDTRQTRAEALGAQLEQLRSEVAAAESRAAEGLPLLQVQVAEVEAAAGLTPVQGPGLELRFADATTACPTGRAEDCRIQDVDLQLAVNTLFALGSEAVAVNGERVISTTAIRSAGGSILVNYRVLTSPYEVQAIGDAGALKEGIADSSLTSDFEVWRDVYGLGFAVTAGDELEVPAFTGSVRLRAATVDLDTGPDVDPPAGAAAARRDTG